MHLHAAFVPPAETVEALAALVTSLEPPSPGQGVTSRRDTPKRGFLSRARATPAKGQEPELPGVPMLHVLETDRMLIPATDFGWLTAEDANRVATTLTRVCAELPPPPTVRVQGGAALVDPDDRSVWASLAAPEEDLQAMRGIAQALVSGIEPLGYFRDRRQFKARFPLATITAATTVEHLERVLAELDDYSSTPWQVSEVTIFKRGSGVWRVLPVGA